MYARTRIRLSVMTQIAKLSGLGFGVHGWVSFCPWRQIVDQDQLKRVQDAVMSGGMIGVKQYPPMGFYPAGNAKAVSDGEVYPTQLTQLSNYGKQLDDNLDALYQWCCKEGVPVLAHCSYSQYPTKTAGLRAAPDGWKVVLSNYPELRLNIGHCGGLWYVPDDASKRPPGTPWAQRTIEILNTPAFAHVSADFADYSTMIEPGADNKRAFDETMIAVKGWLDPATHAQARSRLLYGTDWSMLAQAQSLTRYLLLRSDEIEGRGRTQLIPCRNSRIPRRQRRPTVGAVDPVRSQTSNPATPRGVLSGKPS